MTDSPQVDEQVDEQNFDEDFVPVDDAIIGVAFRWSIVVFVVLGIVGGSLFWYFSRSHDEGTIVIDDGPFQPPSDFNTQVEKPVVQFTEITTASGLEFIHDNGATGQKLLPETMGGGCAFFDFDNDGDQDLLLVNSDHWPEQEYDSPRPVQALYRNDGTGQFQNITFGSGLDVSVYGMGVAVGDYDNDGLVDVFIAAVGSNRLFRNLGDRFEDVTDTTGVAGDDAMWSSSAGFFDYDGDGDLDLFVCNYVAWTKKLDLELNYTLNGTDRAYGPPTGYPGTDSYLYRNNGDGSFSDVSAQAGIQVANRNTGNPMSKALAVTFVDVDRDGDLDIFVANDTVENFAFENNGDGSFTERGLDSGTAVNNAGNATGAMGLDVVEFRNDGILGMGIGNFSSEPSSLFVQGQPGEWSFNDIAAGAGIGSPSRLKLSFGLFFFDYDLDGWLDLLQVNGHLEDEINQVQPSQHYRQPAQLFWNSGPDRRPRFAVLDEMETGDLSRPIVGRGAAYADIDNDGDLDVLLTQTGAAPLLLRNDQQLNHHWLRLKLIGTECNRDAIGAWIELKAGGIIQRRQVMPTRSYLSQMELPVTFGLDDARSIDSITIHWPDGTKQVLQNLAIDQIITVRQADSNTNQ